MLKTAIVFGNKYSGHENMALKLINHLGEDITIYSNLNISTHKKLSFTSIAFLKSIFLQKVLISCGSPYGFIAQKFILFCMGSKIIEYVPFPELIEMQDRFFHRYIPIINRLLIKKRILIEDWQREHSAVSDVFILKNIL